MKIKDLLGGRRPVISFEFFPPKTDDGFSNLMDTVARLKSLQPTYVSITYGAGGSTRQKTVDLVKKIKNEIYLEPMAHLTCVGHTRDEIKTILQDLSAGGIENILALRGDPPRGETNFKPVAHGFHHANELVEFIKGLNSFSIGVAGYPEKHPEAKSLSQDLDYVEQKIKAGGDFIVTQLFFSNTPYFSYVEQLRKRGVLSPVIPGIMPITDADQIKRFSTLCGAVLPEGLLHQLQEAQRDKERVIQIGIDHAVRQCEELLEKGAPGLHFYTLNKSFSTREIFLKLKEKGLVG